LDIEILLLVLLALAFPVSAIVGLVLAVKARRSIALLTARLERLEFLLREDAAPASAAAEIRPEEPEAAPETPATEPESFPAAAEPPRAPVPAIASVPPAEVAPPGKAADGRGLEERLGTRWAVWVGGLALALGGLFLVRYSIEQDLLSPGTRIALGGLFALALAGAGEWLRRRERAVALPGIPSAHVPSILTAAGTCTAFASAYAAYALYDLIGPGTTFVLLGLVAVLAMVAATLHGPALAALGLVGALGSPLLVSSEAPQPWALVIYLVLVVLPAYGVARLRLWRWLALAAAIGALLWALPIFWIDGAAALPAMVHLVLQAGLTAFFLAVDPYRHTQSDDPAILDIPASGVLLAFTAAGIAVASSVSAGDARPIFATGLILILLAAGLRVSQVAPAAAWAALMAVGTLALWPIRTLLGQDPENIFYQSGDLFAVRPDALGAYLTFAALSTPLIAAAALIRLSRSSDLPLRLAAWYAGAASAGPLLALVAAYWRVAALERSLPFALVAALMALLLVYATVWLRRNPDADAPALRLGTGATASAALSALALGLTFALDKGMLTVAFALTALATAWVSEKVAIPALRYAVGAIGLIVAARLAWSPTIVEGNPGPILVNWLLWGYGIPAAAFLLASRLLERSGRDNVVRLTESLAIVFTAFLVFFEIRHALNEGDPLAADFGLLEAGLVATESLAFALVLTRLHLRRSDPVYRVGSLIFKAVSVFLCAGGLLIAANPLLTDDPVQGGVFFNALIPAYLLPAVLSLALALQERRTRPAAYSWTSAILGLLLQMAYVGLAIRRIVQGPELGLWRGFGQGEQWAYSVALLLTGIALLGIGLLRDIRFARLASAVYLVLAVLKVFIVDLANLEGVMRALSFIGLGLVLIGIGLVYQRLLAQRPAGAPATR